MEVAYLTASTLFTSSESNEYSELQVYLPSVLVCELLSCNQISMCLCEIADAATV